ncbi:MAG: acyltransferase [Pelobium sp.]
MENIPLDLIWVWALQRFNYIDSLRGWAILGVLIVHASYVCVQILGVSISNNVFELLGSGQRGVQLFFIVSAFTIFYSWGEKSKKESTPYRNFYLRRFFRIAPVYYLILILTFLKNSSNISTLDFISHFFFINGFIPNYNNSILFVEWSITVEIIFYLLVPILFKIINSLYKAIFLLIISLIITYLCNSIVQSSIFFHSTLIKKFFETSFINQFPVFCIGIVTYQLIMHLKNANIGKYSSLLIIVAGMMVFSFAGISVKFFQNHIIFSFIFSIIFIALSFNPLKLLVNKITSYIGKISFSIYLIHLPILSFIASQIKEKISTSLTVQILLFVFISFFLITIISSSLYYLVEKRGVAIGKNLINQLS